MDKAYKEFITKTQQDLYDILRLASKRSKVDRWKCCINTCKMFLLRIEALKNIVNTGGDSEDLAAGSEIIQQGLYGPIIAYWRKELEK